MTYLSRTFVAIAAVTLGLVPFGLAYAQQAIEFQPGTPPVREHEHEHERRRQPLQPQGEQLETRDLGQTHLGQAHNGQGQQGLQILSAARLRDIDAQVGQLSNITRQLHDVYHDHLEGVRHAEKLDDDVTALEHMAEDLHQLVANAPGNAETTAKLRMDTNAIIQHAFRVQRSVKLTEPWLGGNSRMAVRNMHQLAGSALSAAHQIDAYLPIDSQEYLPVDTQFLDMQVEVLEEAIKELHDEFHEHLEGYEVSQHLDEDLEELETTVEIMHEMAHDKSWAELDMGALVADLAKIRQYTAHIESLFVQQARTGVRAKDWVGIEHSRDAITDVLSSAYLLDHLIKKTVGSPAGQGGDPIVNPPVEDRRKPKRDRHGHPVRQRGVAQ